MRGWGVVLIVLAIASYFLPRVGIQFFVLMWIDNWGATNGLLIRVGMVVLGLVLVAASFRRGQKPAA